MMFDLLTLSMLQLQLVVATICYLMLATSVARVRLAREQKAMRHT